MIDLNMKPKKEEETPAGIIILAMLPIVAVFFLALGAVL